MGRAYKKAPVTEAVVEFRFVSEIRHADVERIRNKLAKSFPTIAEDRSLDLQLSETRVNVNQFVSGYKLSSEDDLKIVLLRPQLVANSRLAPYAGWEDLKSQAIGVLNKVRDVVGRRPIQRIGVRYINRLDIPSNDVQLDDWVNIRLAIPAGLAEAMTEIAAKTVFQMRESINCALAIRGVPSPLIDHSSLLLDLDLSREGEIPLADEPLWALLETMRELKNEVFEACITSRMRDQFGGLVET